MIVLMVSWGGIEKLLCLLCRWVFVIGVLTVKCRVLKLVVVVWWVSL